MDELQAELESLKPEDALVEPVPAAAPRGAARRVQTAVPADELRELHLALLRLPEGFTLHPKLQKAMQRRRMALDNPDKPSVDFAVGRAVGAGFHPGRTARPSASPARMASAARSATAMPSSTTGRPAGTLSRSRPCRRRARPSRSTTAPLSEDAALGFEYGYNVQAPERLVIWEAQYGDFINGAQTMIDEFIVSARAKWGQTPSLVMLLPHGYEGQGPDHSTGRLERFLSLAADTNLRVANCTTAAQYFHLLRRQAHLLTVDPLPLIMFTPQEPAAAARGRLHP